MEQQIATDVAWIGGIVVWRFVANEADAAAAAAAAAPADEDVDYDDADVAADDVIASSSWLQSLSHLCFRFGTFIRLVNSGH